MNDLSHMSSCISRLGLHHSQFLKLHSRQLHLSMVAKGGLDPWGLAPAAGRMQSAPPGTAHRRGQVHKGWLMACPGQVCWDTVNAGLRQGLSFLSFRGLRWGRAMGRGTGRAGPCFTLEVLRPKRASASPRVPPFCSLGPCSWKALQ